MWLPVERILSYDLPPNVDVGCSVEHPARPTADHGVEVPHAAALGPYEWTTDDLERPRPSVTSCLVSDRGRRSNGVP